MIRPAAQAFLLMLAFTVAWVLLEEMLGARLQNSYPLMQVVWCRYAAHLAILLLLFGWREPSRLWRTRRPLFQLARSLLMLLMPLSFAVALRAGTPANVVWATFWVLAPLMLLAATRWWLREAVPAPAWAATALGGIAALAVFAPTMAVSASQLAAPLLMALSFAVYVAMTRSLRDERVHANLFFTAAGVFVVLTPFVAAIWVPPSAHDALVLAAIGAVGLVSLLALDRAAALAPLSGTAAALYLHLPALVAATWIGAGHAPSRRAAAVGLVVVGLLWYVWSRLGATPAVAQATHVMEEGTR